MGNHAKISSLGVDADLWLWRHWPVPERLIGTQAGKKRPAIVEGIGLDGLHYFVGRRKFAVVRVRHFLEDRYLQYFSGIDEGIEYNLGLETTRYKL